MLLLKGFWLWKRFIFFGSLRKVASVWKNSNCHSISLNDWAKPPVITVWYQEILIYYLQFPFSILFYFISVQTIVLVTSVRTTNCLSALSVHQQDQ